MRGRRLCRECDGEGRYETTVRFDAVTGNLVYGVVDCQACGATGWVTGSRRVLAIHWILAALVLAIVAIAVITILAAPRSGSDSTTSQPGVSRATGSAGVSAPAPAGASGPGQSGAPHAAAGLRPTAPGGVPSSSAAGGPRVSQPTDQRASARAAYAFAPEPASLAEADL